MSFVRAENETIVISDESDTDGPVGKDQPTEYMDDENIADGSDVEHAKKTSEEEQRSLDMHILEKTTPEWRAATVKEDMCKMPHNILGMCTIMQVTVEQNGEELETEAAICEEKQNVIYYFGP